MFKMPVHFETCLKATYLRKSQDGLKLNVFIKPKFFYDFLFLFAMVKAVSVFPVIGFVCFAHFANCSAGE